MVLKQLSTHISGRSSFNESFKQHLNCKIIGPLMALYGHFNGHFKGGRNLIFVLLSFQPRLQRSKALFYCIRSIGPQICSLIMPLQPVLPSQNMLFFNTHIPGSNEFLLQKKIFKTFLLSTFLQFDSLHFTHIFNPCRPCSPEFLHTIFSKKGCSILFFGVNIVCTEPFSTLFIPVSCAFLP